MLRRSCYVAAACLMASVAIAAGEEYMGVAAPDAYLATLAAPMPSGQRPIDFPVPPIDLVHPPTPEPRVQTPNERYVRQLVDQLPREKLFELHTLISDPDANAEAIELFVERHLPQLRRPADNSLRRQTTYTYRVQPKTVRRIWRRR